MKKAIYFVALLTLLVGCKDREQKPEEKVLRINVATTPFSLDPRIGGDRRSQVFTRQLFEGLTRLDPSGEVVMGIAQSYEVSPDGKIYTFYLKETKWSNDEPVTAHDFEYAWKKVLDPDFDSIQADVLYVVKNGKAAKERKASLDEIGVRALDDTTLQVELEHPAPYFIELTSNGVLFPVLHTLDDKSPGWPNKQETYVGNGPFRLKEWTPDCRIVTERNPLYWDAESVQIDGVNASIVNDANSVLQLYQNGELDWVGDPFSELPIDAMVFLDQKGELNKHPIEATFRFTFNTEKAPFQSKKMRYAFAYALDRQSLIDNTLKGGEVVAGSLLPPSLSLSNSSYVPDRNPELARQYFEEGLEELGMTREDLSEIVLSYPTIEDQVRLVQALQQQWESVLGVPIKLEGHEFAVFFSKYSRGDYQLGGLQWFSAYHDPSYNLNFYRSASYRMNFSNWERDEFTELMECSDQEVDVKRRTACLQKAEAFLMEEMPMLPVYSVTYRYAKSDNFQDIYITPSGFVDFKWTTIQ